MQLGPVIPILRSFSEAKMREFYIDFLGFRIDWQHRFGPDFPLYCQLSLDGVALHLSEHHGDCTPGSAVRIAIDDVDAYHRELQTRSYVNAKPGVETQPWGTREMCLTDPSGNRLFFCTADAPSESTDGSAVNAK